MEDTHKVIDPPLPNDPKAELKEIKAVPVQRTQEKRLRADDGSEALLNQWG